MSSQQQKHDDTLKKVNEWLDIVEKKAKQYLAIADAGEIDPIVAAELALKYVLTMLRLLDKRHDLTGLDTDDASRMLIKMGFANEEELRGMLHGEVTLDSGYSISEKPGRDA